ncbi:MAG: alpha/beta fold hydrolase [Proteobacteria bacterium]|nr:alpha/beta fold hydrolase [Pseudomonadota bacterium]
MSVVGYVGLVVVLLLLLVTIVTQFVGSAAAQNPRRGRITRVRGGTIHWVDRGSGQPVVMIHGLGGNHLNFTYALTSKLEADFRVIAIDRPGCGWSERDGADQATLAEQARMIADFIAAEDLGQPLVVGHSLGGAIALALALNHPDRVGALTLICPTTAPIDKVPDAFKGIDIKQPWLIPVIGHTFSGAMALLMEKKIFTAIFAPEPLSDGFLERGGGMLGRRPESFIAAAQDMARSRASASDVVGREGELKVPMGILFGADDAILDPAIQVKALADRTGADYAELPGRGHMIPLTAPADCAGFIRRMAGKLPS